LLPHTNSQLRYDADGRTHSFWMLDRPAIGKGANVPGRKKKNGRKKFSHAGKDLGALTVSGRKRGPQLEKRGNGGGGGGKKRS